MIVSNVIDPVAHAYSGEADDSDFEVLGDIEWVNADFEFNMSRVYRRKSDGALFGAWDSGCSCPIPFEGTTEADLFPIRRMADWYAHVKARRSQHGAYYGGTSHTDVARINRLVKENL